MTYLRQIHKNDQGSKPTHNTPAPAKPREEQTRGERMAAFRESLGK